MTAPHEHTRHIPFQFSFLRPVRLQRCNSADIPRKCHISALAPFIKAHPNPLSTCRRTPSRLSAHLHANPTTRSNPIATALIRPRLRSTAFYPLCHGPHFAMLLPSRVVSCPRRHRDKTLFVRSIYRAFRDSVTVLSGSASVSALETTRYRCKLDTTRQPNRVGSCVSCPRIGAAVPRQDERR